MFAPVADLPERGDSHFPRIVQCRTQAEGQQSPTVARPGGTTRGSKPAYHGTMRARAGLGSLTAGPSGGRCGAPNVSVQKESRCPQASNMSRICAVNVAC